MCSLLAARASDSGAGRGREGPGACEALQSIPIAHSPTGYWFCAASGSSNGQHWCRCRSAHHVRHTL
eukprot:1146433-Pelagomonas_calceolata.AAC.1